MGCEITVPHTMRGQLMLFQHADALAALAQLQQAGAIILGADQLRLVGQDGIQPVDDIDVSAGYKGEPYSAVREFIACRPSDPCVVYELVWN